MRRLWGRGILLVVVGVFFGLGGVLGEQIVWLWELCDIDNFPKECDGNSVCVSTPGSAEGKWFCSECEPWENDCTNATCVLYNYADDDNGDGNNGDGESPDRIFQCEECCQHDSCEPSVSCAWDKEACTQNNVCEEYECKTSDDCADNDIKKVCKKSETNPPFNNKCVECTEEENDCDFGCDETTNTCEEMELPDEDDCDFYEDWDDCAGGLSFMYEDCCACDRDRKDATICACIDAGKKAKTAKSCSDEYGPQYTEDGDCCATACEKTVTKVQAAHGLNCVDLYGSDYKEGLDNDGCCIKKGDCSLEEQALAICTTTDTCTNEQDLYDECMANSAATDCSKWVLDVAHGQKCCPGYKKEKTGPATYTCMDCEAEGVCCGIELNTVVPFIGDCIKFKGSSNDTNTTVVWPTTAFPVLMKGLSRLLVTAIMIFSFLLLVVAGVLMTFGDIDTGKGSGYSVWKQLIGKVIIGIALLGASGVILKLINPNFFG